MTTRLSNNTEEQEKLRLRNESYESLTQDLLEIWDKNELKTYSRVDSKFIFLHLWWHRSVLDKVYVDFIVHSSITTELCLYEHYLYALGSAKCFFFSSFQIHSRDLLQLFIKLSLWNQISIPATFRKSFLLSKPIRSNDLFEYATYYCTLNASTKWNCAEHIITDFKWRSLRAERDGKISVSWRKVSDEKEILIIRRYMQR